MCGITGLYSPNNLITRNDLEMMTESLLHRGPDASGYFYDNIVGLGHRRLSIIDLSEAANQPMHSHSDRYVIAYNGEVYNFKEIKEDILKYEAESELPIRIFKSNSDTEVILEAFSLWGKDFVHKLNGMFVISIYDKEAKKLYIFRDRIGIKPLFYFFDGKALAFSSELKALKKVKYINEKISINRNAIPKYLHLGYIPGPETIYENIQKLPSGSCMECIQNNENSESIEVKIESYWQIKEQVQKEVIKDEKEAKETLKNLLEESVKYRLISDVSYGTFLSGGTDSSLVTAIAQKVNNAPLNTFSIGFKEAGFNEAPFAKEIANYLGTKHHEFIVSYEDAINLTNEILDSYDEPYADSSAIPTMLVSKLAKEFVTMTLSGDGGDELFHGYGSYKWAERLSSPLVKAAKTPIEIGLSMMSSRYKRVGELFNFNDKMDLKSHIFSQEQYLFSLREINSMLKEDYKMDFTLDDDYSNLSRDLTPAESQAIFDINYYLKDDLLVKVDRASMKYSLETRVPLLDHRILSFALNLDPKLKVKGGIQKYLLKEVLYDYIPKSLLERPKRGFAIPLSQWLKKELHYLITDYLSDKVIQDAGIVDLAYVKMLLSKFESGNYDYLYNRIWVLIVLHQFILKS